MPKKKAFVFSKGASPPPLYWFHLPSLPKETYDSLCQLCLDHNLTQWQAVVMAITICAKLTPEQIGPFVEHIKR